MTSQTNILNSDGEFKYSNLQELKMAQEYQDLKNMSDTVNELNKEGKKKEKIYNLSLKDLGINFLSTWTNIINELTNIIYNEKKNKDFNNYLNIFVINDRLLYVGLMFIFISLFLFFVTSTE